ncbi:L10-interacting MYB domain-containing protein [Senna tora]|uniref:L10-interacting MYB domain-containing protein n=1 Tax=Senna tora TaxID=362788 RepID=A0A834TJE1_9FABA|nr:L10-interacting MYB domain-containing protein [Senna tora]
MATSGTKDEAQETTPWPKLVVKCYIDIMVEEVNKGNMTNGVFTPKVWKNILEKINSKCRHAFTLKQIEQKFKRLWIQDRDFSQLLQHNGFGWNAETNTITADDEVWSRYILYKKNGLEHYNLLGIIFNRSTATGVLHHSSTQAPPDSQQERELENEYLYGGTLMRTFRMILPQLSVSRIVESALL